MLEEGVVGGVLEGGCWRRGVVGGVLEERVL